MALMACLKAAGRDCVVLIPEYFCEEALTPLRKLQNIRFEFYGIRDDLSPDWEALKRISKRPGSKYLMVLVHYFGFHQDVKFAREFCDNSGFVLIEDSAHILRPTSPSPLGDFLIFSPWKLLPIPEGGILLSKRTPNDHRLQDFAPEISSIRWSNFKWLGKRVAQRLLLSLGLSWHSLWKSYDDDNPQVQDERLADNPPVSCDILTARMLSVLSKSVDEISAVRRRNYRRLLEWTATINEVDPIFHTISDDSCPYVFPLTINGDTKMVAQRLQRKGIPASKWPNLPNEILSEPERYERAIKIRNRTLLLPVHQSLSLHTVDFMGKQLALVYKIRASS